MIRDGSTPARPRFPRWLFKDGSEPDPRFTLANERTFLAWIRTGLALVAGGVALQSLGLPLHPTLRLTAALVLIVTGIAAPIQAWIGWAHTERAMRHQRPLPAPTLALPIGIAVGCAGILVLFAVALT